MRKLNQKGSFLIWFTLSFALLATFVGFALDFGRAYLEKARISRLVDGAAIVAAKALKGQVGLENEATRAACDSMSMNGATVVMSSATTCSSVAGAPFTATVSFFDRALITHVRVTANEPVPTTFLRFLGWMVPGNYSTINVSVVAEAGPEIPIDLMLVLDRSGSMNIVDGSGTLKLDALKIATNAFLDNNFTSDDHIGMTSFGYRGCGAGGIDSTTSTGVDCPADKAIGSSISSIKTAVNSLNAANGSTNTMEGLKTAKTEITVAVNDVTRASTRKAVLLITDGRPTSTRRFNDTECKRDPIDGTDLSTASPPVPIVGPFPNGCIHSVFTNATNNMYWNPLTSFGSGNTIDGAPRYLHGVNFARTAAVSEANAIKNLATKSVLVYVIAIGRVEPIWGNSLDDNAKCLLGRIANDPTTVTTSCPNVFTTLDNDTYPDLLPCKANPASCIDNTQQTGRVFTIDLSGNVKQQLDAVFKEVALLLKLRLTL
jgi:Flp pilus assembly protein TadG